MTGASENETSPVQVLQLASRLVHSLEDTQASAGEKLAALRTAAYAIEQAASVQQLAVMMANYIEASKPPTKT